MGENAAMNQQIKELEEEIAHEVKDGKAKNNYLFLVLILNCR